MSAANSLKQFLSYRFDEYHYPLSITTKASLTKQAKQNDDIFALIKGVPDDIRRIIVDSAINIQEWMAVASVLSLKNFNISAGNRLTGLKQTVGDSPGRQLLGLIFDEATDYYKAGYKAPGLIEENIYIIQQLTSSIRTYSFIDSCKETLQTLSIKAMLIVCVLFTSEVFLLCFGIPLTVGYWWGLWSIASFLLPSVLSSFNPIFLLSIPIALLVFPRFQRSNALIICFLPICALFLTVEFLIDYTESLRGQFFKKKNEQMKQVWLELFEKQLNPYFNPDKNL